MNPSVRIPLLAGLVLAGMLFLTQTIGAQDLEKDVETLFASLMSDDPLVSEEAREELLLLGRRAAPALARHLQDKEAATRYVVCDLLGQMGDAGVVPAVIERLKDEQSYMRSVRSAAARALGRLGDAKAAPALIEAVKKTEDADLQYEAAVALGALRATEATDALVGLLTSDAKTYHEMLVAAAAAQALGRLKAEKAVPEIAKLLDKSLREMPTDRSLAYYAARALERISGQTFGSLTQSDETRDAAIAKWKEWVASRSGEKKPTDGEKGGASK